MKIAVLGCGAIGGLFLGYLSESGFNVTGVVRDYQKAPINNDGLIIIDKERTIKLQVNVVSKLNQAVDMAIFATKINNLEEIIEDNIKYLKSATVISTQNGIEADYILNKYFKEDKIITSIVMFGATFYAPRRVVHNFGNSLIIGNVFDSKIEADQDIIQVLRSVFTVESIKNIKGAKYSKIFINLNNCIPALLGKPMQEVFSDIDFARLAILISREAYSIVERSDIELADLPTYPKERLHALVSMPVDQAAELFSKIMQGLSKKPLYGSILQSIERGKKSEIDYINGQIVKLANNLDLQAPLNKKIVDLVKQVERSTVFFSKEDVMFILQGEFKN